MLLPILKFKQLRLQPFRNVQNGLQRYSLLVRLHLCGELEQEVPLELVHLPVDDGRDVRDRRELTRPRT